jgi:hypothetical protein
MIQGGGRFVISLKSPLSLFSCKGRPKFVTTKVLLLCRRVHIVKSNKLTYECIIIFSANTILHYRPCPNSKKRQSTGADASVTKYMYRILHECNHDAPNNDCSTSASKWGILQQPRITRLTVTNNRVFTNITT